MVCFEEFAGLIAVDSVYILTLLLSARAVQYSVVCIKTYFIWVHLYAKSW